MDIQAIVTWVQNNWVTVGAIILAFDNLLFAIAPLTPWKWDDTLASRLQDILQKFFRKG